MIRALHQVRQRPLSSLSLVCGGGLLGYCSFLEYQANQAEKLFLTDQTKATSVAALPRAYDWQALTEFWGHRPLSMALRFGQISYHLVPRVFAYVRDFYLFRCTDPAVQEDHAARLREALTQLGPAFVKAGQQLSIRPDLVPPVVLRELQKLCDAVKPVSDEIALRVMREELQTEDLDSQFEDLRLVASASLGQVYKAKLRSTGAEVAVKIQRPDMRRSFSLDLYILQHIGVMVDILTSTFTNQPPFHKALYESFAAGSYSELDYEHEAANQKSFRKELSERSCPVVIPRVYDELTSEKMITSQWIDGIKLADAPKERIRELIPVGVELFLTQLLDIGAFHAGEYRFVIAILAHAKA